MDITVNDPNLTYLTTGISIKKITISSISIDPLKRIANFTVSYWNGSVLLGQETKTYNATYTMAMTTQPTLKSISMPVITTYNTTITLNNIAYTIDTTLFPYFTSGLTIYYKTTDPSIISLEPIAGHTQFDNAMFTSGDRPSSIDIFYTIGSIQYNITGILSPSSKPTAGITTIYYNSDRTKISLTMDSIFNDKYQLIQSDTILVRSVKQNLPQTQTYSYVNISTPIYKSSDLLPSLNIYYNPDNISDISLKRVGVYTTGPITARFFSVVKDSTNYIFSNINYAVGNKNITLSKTINVQLDSTNLPDLSSLYCNPLNQSDISITPSNPDDYTKLLTFLNAPATLGSISPLIKILNTSFSTKTVTIDDNSNKIII
jgi:hypothetical protein